MFYRSFLLLVIFFCFPVLAQDQSDDDTDFSQPNAKQQAEDDLECKLSKDSELINLLNFKLRKFNPTSKEFEAGPPLTDEEIKHKSIRFYLFKKFKGIIWNCILAPP